MPDETKETEQSQGSSENQGADRTAEQGSSERGSADSRSASPRSSNRRPSGSGGSGGSSDRRSGGPQDRRRSGGYRGRRRGYFRKKVCRLCVNKIKVVDYKDVDLLKRFVTDRGKILPRRMTGTCAKHQRMLSHAVKRARMVALLPFAKT